MNVSRARSLDLSSVRATRSPNASKLAIELDSRRSAAVHLERFVRETNGGNDSPFASPRFRTFNDFIDDEEVIAFEAYRGTDYPRVSGSPSGALGDFPGR